MRNIDACLYVSPGDRSTLERLVADGKTAQKIVARAEERKHCLRNILGSNAHILVPTSSSMLRDCIICATRRSVSEASPSRC